MIFLTPILTATRFVCILAFDLGRWTSLLLPTLKECQFRYQNVCHLANDIAVLHLPQIESFANYTVVRVEVPLYTIDVKNVSYVFYYFYKKRVFNVFYFWNVFYFLVEKFFILLNPLKSY